MAVDRILMIVSDTVRTDMLGYNGGGVRTPNLDRLAARVDGFRSLLRVEFSNGACALRLSDRQTRVCRLVGWGALPRTDRSIAHLPLIMESHCDASAWADMPLYQVV